MSQVIIEFIGKSEFKDVESSLNKVEGLTEETKKKFQELEKPIDKANNEAKELTTSIKNFNKEISNNAVKQGVKEVEKLATKADGLTKTFTSAKQELRALTVAINSGKLSGKELQEATERAAELTDNISDVSDKIRQLSSDTRSIDLVVEGASAMAGAFSIAEGASALLGGQNEDLQKSILRVQAAMTVLNGTQELANTLTRQGGIASLAYDTALKVVDATQKTLAISARAAWIAITGGIALVVGAIVGLIAYWDELSSAIFGASVDMGKFNEQNEKASKIQKDIADAYELTERRLKALGAAQSEISANSVKGVSLQLSAANLQLGRLFLQQKEAQKAVNEAEKERLSNVSSGSLGAISGIFNQLFDKLEEKKNNALSISKNIAEQKKLIEELKVSLLEAESELTNAQTEESNKRIERIRTAKDERLRIAKEEKERLLALQREIEEIQKADINDRIAALERLRLKQETNSKEELETLAAIRNEKIRLLEADSTLSIDVRLLKIEEAKQEYYKFQAAIEKADQERIKRTNELLATNRTLQQGLEEDFNKTKLEIEEDFEKSSFDTFAEYAAARRAEWQKEIDQRKQGEQEIQKFAFDTFTQIFNTLFAIDSQNRREKYNQSLAFINGQKEAEIKAIQDKEQQGVLSKEAAEAQKAVIDERYRRQEAALKQQQYEAEKQAKLAQAGINGALAITQVLATSNYTDFGVSAAIQVANAIAQTAASIAVIAATPIPQFKEGTKGGKVTPPGFKLVGEEGAELIYTGGGEKVITAPDTAKILNAYNIQTANPSHYTVDKTKTPNFEIDYDRLAKSFANELKNNPSLNIEINENGFMKYYSEKNHTKQILNKKYKFS